MKNPTSQQFKRVIKNFDKVLPLATERGHLDMDEGELASDKEHICGTPMCHGGWYAVANDIFNDDYWVGADLMSEHLGLKNVYRLIHWAGENPDLWGNSYGSYMLHHNGAFNGAKTLRGIRNWWAQVHNRTCPRAKPVEMV